MYTIPHILQDEIKQYAYKVSEYLNGLFPKQNLKFSLPMGISNNV
jgi:hypothetical protein